MVWRRGRKRRRAIGRRLQGIGREHCSRDASQQLDVVKSEARRKEVGKWGRDWRRKWRRCRDQIWKRKWCDRRQRKTRYSRWKKGVCRQDQRGKTLETQRCTVTEGRLFIGGVDATFFFFLQQLSWSDIVAEYDGRSAPPPMCIRSFTYSTLTAGETSRRTMSWADRCESPPDGLPEMPRSPGRAIHLHQRLSSPSRKR